MRSRFARVLLLSAACSLLLVARAAAQSSIAGLVTDESGAVLPGVTVEAASPALIEKVRTVATDAQGRFTVVNLKPGQYVVTFTLAGFNVAKRDGLTLPDNFTATVNAVLKVGALAETVTVKGESPIVDVQRVQQTQVVSREQLDTIPTGRSYRSVAGLVTAIRPSRQSIADSGPNAQNLDVRGMGTISTIVLFDGLTTTSLGSIGAAAYSNDAAVQEVSYQTSANTADISTGGLRVNLVPRDGGNIFHGGGFFGDLEGKWQSNNLTPELQQRGLTVQNKSRFSRDSNPWIGGPLIRDHVWFLGSYRRTSNSLIVANAFYRDGSPGQNNISITNDTGRLTTQVTKRNKITAYLDRVFRDNREDVGSGQEPETASPVRDSKHGLYVVEQVRWTSTISDTLLFEAGWGFSAHSFLDDARPGILKERGTPEWYATAPHSDTVLGKTWKAYNVSYQQPTRHHLMSALSYVTGSHNMKFGVDWQWGELIRTADGNADLTQIYLNGVPSFVDVRSSPSRTTEILKADAGVYAMDSWRFKRLTANAGVRFDYYNAGLGEQAAPAGRFVPARHYDPFDCLPCFPMKAAPRLGVAYDLFGNGKTALKLGVNKYFSALQLSLTGTYNPLAQAAGFGGGVLVDRRTWRDLNGDDIAQDNEIGPSNNKNFLTGAPSRRPDPNLQHPYIWEYSVGLQHELFPGVAVSGLWDLRQFRNLIVTRNALAGFSDYTPFQITSPLNGSPITVYKLNPAKQGLVDLIDTTATDPNKSRQTYTSYELNINARLPKGATVFGGVVFERTVAVNCDVNDPNLRRFCDQTGTLYQELGAVPSIPYRKNIKVSGSHPLPFGFNVSVAFQSYEGCGSGNCLALASWLPVSYTVPSALFPGGQTQSVTVDLATPATRFLDRWNQLDLSFQKTVRVRRVDLEGRLELFNATNTNPVTSQTTAFGPRLGQPTEILVGRVPRIALQVRF